MVEEPREKMPEVVYRVLDLLLVGLGRTLEGRWKADRWVAIWAVSLLLGLLTFSVLYWTSAVLALLGLYDAYASGKRAARGPGASGS